MKKYKQPTGFLLGSIFVINAVVFLISLICFYIVPMIKGHLGNRAYLNIMLTKMLIICFLSVLLSVVVYVFFARGNYYLLDEEKITHHILNKNYYIYYDNIVFIKQKSRKSKSIEIYLADKTKYICSFKDVKEVKQILYSKCNNLLPSQDFDKKQQIKD